MRGSLLREVARREIRTRARTQAFRVVTGLLVVAAIIGPIVVALVPAGDDEAREVVVGVVPDDSEVGQQFGVVTPDLSLRFVDIPPGDVDDLVAGGDIDVAIEPGPTIVWDSEADFEVAAVLVAAIQQREVLAEGRALGLAPDEVADLLSPVVVGERFVDEVSDADELADGVAFIGLMLSFTMAVVFGQLAMLSVVEEKSTRVVEVLLGHLEPRTLLAGKVIGVSALAVVQLLVVIAGIAAGLAVTDAVDVPASVWRFVPVIALSVLGALIMYNTFFALLGSLVSRQEDAAQVSGPTLIPLTLGLFTAQAAVFGDADALWFRLLTWFPLTTPMLLPVRVAQDAIPAWEVALSLAILVLGIVVLMRLAGRVYEFTLLHTGSRIGWGELVRLSRGAVVGK